MKKFLKEMTDEELWQLFPVILSEHKSYWKDYYNTEKYLLERIIGENIICINHIGSTAIPGLIAKPTIDILMEISENTDTAQLLHIMEGNGYIYTPQPKNPAPHMMFMKGYALQGFEEKVFHVHIRYKGDWDEIHFRDYLLFHPEVAEVYGLIKLELRQIYEHNRDAYTLAKSDFIKKITKLARESGY
ncbi:GrpB family protein [Prevotella sp. 10(H)]|uniref:GrpB family protein n=1 Tax=Prevotella sp. 10(H) TaxID=1158294 RepID=UPI0004A71ECD|nr:GrpB family protein [Prevotella sp. 10(H)]